jgi:hypothetical protein
MLVTTHIGPGGVAGAPPALPGAAGPRGSSPLRLFRFERRWAVAIFETVLPSGEAELPVGAAQAPLGRFLDDFLARAPLTAVLGLRASLWLLMLAPLFVLGRARTFLGLSSPERVALLDRLRRSELYLVRESALLFKIVGCLGLCGLAPLQQRLGIFPVDPTLPPWASP